ncbi:MAG: beta-lactamase family protein [Spirosomaceae bacterium]|nr:beta-lactamase family protein [Spirosomataceae bacterium]
MKTSRRHFLQSSAFGAVGMSFLPRTVLFSQKSTGKLPRQSPESQGVDSAGIRAFLKATKASGLEWHSFMLVRHGNVVAEGWWNPFKPDFKHTLYSLSKSFTSTAIGFLVQEGKLSVNDPVLRFFPEEAPQNPSDNLKAMTIKHLLTMNTGQSTDTIPVMRANMDKNWVKLFLEQPVEHVPSTFFVYNTGATYMLGAIVTKVTGQLLEDYLKPRLFDPLGISDYDWEKSPQGLNTAGYGLRVTTEDIAKFGQFYLQKGQWQGKQLLAAEWVAEATSKQTTSREGDNDWSQGYGYQFWRCKPGFYRGDGAYGQFCMVMPEYGAVLAMTCESFDLQKSMNVAYETLLPALKKAVLPENPSEWQALKSEIAQLALPVAKGSKTSVLHAKYSDKVFKIEPNPFNITRLGLGLFDDAGVIRVAQNNETGFHKIGFGWEEWKSSKVPVKNYFVTNPNPMPSKIAATGTWLNENTLQVHCKFIDAIHGDKLTFVFEGDKVTVSMLNSISENSKNNPDKREKLIGTM